MAIMSEITEKERELLGPDYRDNHDIRENPGQRNRQEALRGIIHLDEPLTAADFIRVMMKYSALLYIDGGCDNDIDCSKIAAHPGSKFIEWEFMPTDGISMEELKDFTNYLIDMGYTPRGVFLIEEDLGGTCLLASNASRLNLTGEEEVIIEESTASFTPDYIEQMHAMFDSIHNEIKAMEPLQHSGDEQEL